MGAHGNTAKLTADKNNFAFVGGYGNQAASGHGNAGYKTTALAHTRLGESPEVGGTYDLAIQKVGDSVKLYFNGEVAAECSADDLQIMQCMLDYLLQEMLRLHLIMLS